MIFSAVWFVSDVCFCVRAYTDVYEPKFEANVCEISTGCASGLEMDVKSYFFYRGGFFRPIDREIKKYAKDGIRTRAIKSLVPETSPVTASVPSQTSSELHFCFFRCLHLGRIRYKTIMDTILDRNGV